MEYDLEVRVLELLKEGEVVMSSVVVDALSRKERCVKPRCVFERMAMNPFSYRFWHDDAESVRERLDSEYCSLHPQADRQKKLKALARDRHKSYADNRRKPLEFKVGDRVMLKVSPWKVVIRFGKKSERDRFIFMDRGTRPNVDCYNCGKHGHYAKDCRSAKRTEENSNLVTKPEVEESGILLMAHEEQSQKLIRCDRCERTWDQKGKESTIEDVYYVPAMKSNILSLGQLMEKGYWVLMKNGKMLLKNKEGVIIALVKMCKNRTFKLNLNSVAQKCLKADLSDKESVWHLRFGHLHFHGLKELTRKNMVHGLPDLNYDDHFCEDCVLGKQTRSSFPKNANYRAKELLELIHSDVCGPLSPVSFGNKRYFVTFIDDFSRKCWVYFLEQKSEVFETFKKFKATVEKTTGQYIKALRSDRGGEYLSISFIKFCEEQGIKRFLTTPYTPQQNGIAERKNQTIMNMVRSMLKSKNMPKEFWAEAVQCVVYIKNRCPHVKLGDKTPQECWSGVKPMVSHFKVFGNVAYAHAYAKEILKRSKMEDCNPVVTPMEFSTRPDLSYSVGVLLKNTAKSYSDSDWQGDGDVDDRKSTSASWNVCHAIWLRNLLRELKNQQDGPTEIKVENKSAIELARNPVHHERSKHIDVRFHFIREHIRNRDVQLTHVMSRDQAADIFTKALPAELFNLCKQKMGMKDARDLSLREEFVG
ncbi:retrovirus-related pol polyprotein from transposon TNT 1-94 [Tanacetum coccineum]